MDEAEDEETDEGRFLSLAALTIENDSFPPGSKEAAIELRWAEITDWKEKLREGQLKDANWRYAIEQTEAGGRHSNFIVKEDLLYLRYAKHGEAFDRLCVPAFARQTILRAFHNQVDAAHLGVHKTTRKITRRYVWPKMHEQIRKFVLACGDCQTRKGLNTAKA